MKDLIDSAIREVNQHFDSTDYMVIEPEELKSFFLAKLPEDLDYQVLNITGNQTNLKASFVTKDITNDNLVNWLTEFEIINNVSLKIKTKKKTNSWLCCSELLQVPSQHAKMESIQRPSAKTKGEPICTCQEYQLPFSNDCQD